MAKQVAIEIDIQGTKDVIELQKQIRETNKAIKETDDIEAYNKLAADLVRLKSELREARKAQRQAVDAFAATDESVGAYSRLSAQLRVARNNLKDLQAAGTTTGEEVDKLTAEINQLDSTLKEIDRSVGQTNREIGAYEEAVRQAVGITDAQAGAFTRLKGRAEVLRRAYRDVATAQGANSEEAKKLQKELARVEKQLKAVGNTAEQTNTRLRSARSQFREFAGGLGAIGGAFVAFEALPGAIANVQDLAEGIEGLLSFLSPTVALNNRFAESVGEVANQFVNEKSELNALFSVAQDDNATRAERSAAIDQINTQYGDYLPNLLTEASSLEEIAAAQEAATDALIKDLAAQAQRQQLTNIIDEFAQAEASRAAQAAEAETTLGGIADFASGLFGQVVEFSTAGLVEVDTRLSTVNNAITDAQQESLKSQAENIDQIGTQTENFLKDLDEQLNATFGTIEGENKEFNQNLAKEQARAASQRARQQESFLKQEEKRNEARANILLGLERQIIEAQLDLQEEGQEKALQQEINALNERTAELEKQQAKFIADLETQQAKINELFGAESQRALQFAQQVAIQREQITTQTNAAIEAETEASLQRRSDIRKQFAGQEASDARKALQDRIRELNEQRQAVANAVNIELLEIRERRARGRIDEEQAEKESFEKRVQNIKDQLAQLRGEEFALTAEVEIGVDVPQEEFDKILLARQTLNTQLAELEEKQTAKLEQEAEKRAEIRQKGLEFALNSFNDVVGGIGQIAELANNAEAQRLERLQEERQANIESLNQELQNASGLEKAFLEQRVQQETEAANEIAAAQERARKEAAIAQKAVSITQAIINTALAITQALASLPPPASFVTAAITGALGAVQIATIAAQPLATGGIVGFNGGGKVSQPQNIKTQPNGDNVLATLKRGEVVLNQRQQTALGGSKTFRSIGVPGFQRGGIVSPPINAPTLAESVRDENSIQALVQTNQKLIASVNARIDRLEVVYTTNTEEAINRDQTDRKEINERATL